MMRIRVANAPVSWGIMEVEGWSQPLTATAFLDELASAGYEGTELGPYGYLPTDPGALRDELARRSLTLTSAFVPLRLKDHTLDLEPLRRVARLLRALEVRYLVLADALWPEREAVAGRASESGRILSEDGWKTVTRQIDIAAATARDYGLRPVFHHHAGTYIETPAEIARLMESTSVGLCLDTGHCAYGGGDPVAAVDRFGVRVEYLHLKDLDPVRLADARHRGLGFLDAVRAGVFCPLGAGSVRFPELLRALNRAAFDGWAVVEQDVEAASPSACTASARASRDYLRSTLGI